MVDTIGNLPPLPGIFPDRLALVIRNTAAGRELGIMRWRFPVPAGRPRPAPCYEHPQYRVELRARVGGRPGGRAVLLGQGLARAAEVRGKVPELRQAVTHPQDRLGIIHVHPGTNARSGSVAANTSTRSSVGCTVIRCPPHTRQHVRWLIGVLAYIAT